MPDCKLAVHDSALIMLKASLSSLHEVDGDVGMHASNLCLFASSPIHKHSLTPEALVWSMQHRYSALGKAQAGVFMLRPCRAVAQHMEALVLSDTRLQFRYGHAEQDFLDWCDIDLPDHVSCDLTAALESS